MVDATPLWLRLAGNILVLGVFIGCYIAVFRQRGEALTATKARVLIHVYYCFSIFSNLFASPKSIFSYLVLSKALTADRQRTIWRISFTAIYDALNRVVPAILVAIIIVSAIDSLYNMTARQRFLYIFMGLYVPAALGVACGCLLTPDFCDEASASYKVLMYTNEALIAFPYVIAIIAIVVLFWKSRGVAEIDCAIALLREEDVTGAIQGIDYRKKQLTGILVMRVVAMTLLLIWNVVWISALAGTEAGAWVSYVETGIYVVYEVLNSFVFVSQFCAPCARM